MSGRELDGRSVKDSSKDRLDALADFLPTFEGLDFEFGHFVDEPGKLGYNRFSDDALRFIHIFYKMGWVNPSFRWVTWRGSSEALQLRDEPATLEAARTK